MKEDEDSSEPFIPYNSGEIITTSSPEENYEFSSKPSDDNIEQIDQDKVQMELIELNAEFTNVQSVLKLTDLDQKDNFDLVKFSIKAKAVYDYEWEVYHKPSEIKKNFSEIHSELSKNHINPTANIAAIFTTVSDYQDESVHSNLNEIVNYYKALFQDSKVKSSLSLKEFFNISIGSFNQYNNGQKPFEGYCYKKADPHLWRTVLSYTCFCIEKLAFSEYNLRWIVVKDDCIYYMDKSNSDTGKNVYFFDSDLKINKVGKDVLEVVNVSRSIVMKFRTFFERELWYTEIVKRDKIMKNVLKNNVYKSYTNEKRGNKVHWFSDGQEYFKDLKEKLMEAKESIFITDWWMSPEVFLERPVGTQTYASMAYHHTMKKESPPYSRLMDILYQCANRGVKVYVLVYAECSLALTLNSAHTENSLVVLHPNIQVTRHPQNCTDLLWSHHEKLVIIDQIIGYVGGLDLCWGRWDTNDHPLYEAPNSEENYNFPAIDYSNARICDFTDVDNYLKESVDRKTQVRMPWHDVHSRLIGPVVADIARHFVERWNFSRFGSGEGIVDIKSNYDVSKENSYDATSTIDENINAKKKAGGGFMANIINQVNNQNQNDNALMPEDEKKEEINENEYIQETQIKKTKMKGPTKLRGRKKNDVVISGSSNDEDINTTSSENINTNRNLRRRKKDITKKKGYDEEYGIRARFNAEKESSDGDHILVPKGQTQVKLRGRLNKNIKRIKQAQMQANKAQTEVIGNSNSDIELNESDTTKSKDSGYYAKFVKNVGDYSKQNKKSWISQFLKTEEKQLEANVVNVNFFQKGTKSRVQVLRSACKWSVGISKKENSILQAYYKLIDCSKHFIYIENQFFVSRAFNEEEMDECDYALSDVVENMIAYHIRKRIERAYQAKEKFRVFVFIPLLPGFAGEPESSGTLQIILKHTYAGICRNHGMSIIEQLEKIMGDEWKNYIGFYSLRGHAIVNNKPVTELIYIHSKLMIVDDRTVILGSANINDRSMLGTRDSEYAVLINESNKLMSKMDGKDYKCAGFAATFRRHLFAEHFGINKNSDILVDPLSDDLLKLCRETAENNTLIYRKVFGCYPDDNYKTFKDLREMRKFESKEEIDELKVNYEAEKRGIIGHAVEFPLHFLEDEKLGISFFSVENLVPEKNFT